MFCSNCGVKVAEGEQFCSNCGSGAVTGPEKAQGPGLSPRIKKTIFIVAGLLVVLLVVFLVISPFGGGGQSTPQQALESFFKALQRGNAKQMVDLIDPQAIKEMEAWGVSKELLAMQMEFLVQAVDLRSYQVLDVEVTGDRARVQVYMKVRTRMFGLEEEEEETTYIELVNRNGKWYIGEDFF